MLKKFDDVDDNNDKSDGDSNNDDSGDDKFNVRNFHDDAAGHEDADDYHYDNHHDSPDDWGVELIVMENLMPEYFMAML